MAIAVPAGARKLIHPSYEGSGVYGGLSPGDLTSAYKLPSKSGSGQTIAIIDAWDDPKAESDLAVYREKYGLPPCTTANGCFKKVNQKGETKNYPEGEPGWATEISLDLDMASAVCPECHIILVEANDEYNVNLYPAQNTAVALGATVISNSWGSNEYSEETDEDKYFNHPGIPTTFSTGDFGYGNEYPASSRNVIAVGGTALKKDAGTRGWAEEAWRYAGSGCSLFETKPTWQKDAKCSHRMVSDVSAVADPQTGVSIYDSYEWYGWDIFGGTSASSPIVAGVEALSSSATRAAGAETFYKNPNLLFDISAGYNGACTPPSENEYFCNGVLEYDGPTGNGTPNLTPSGKPAVAAHASEVKPYETQLKGTVNPEGLTTTYRFEYGPTISYGQTSPIATEPGVGAGSTPVSVGQSAYSLSPEHTYHFRLTASNAKGTTYGEDHSFTTTGPSWVSSPTYVSAFGSEGSGPGQFQGVGGIGVSPLSGTLAVTDMVNNRIQEFTEAGTYIRQFGSKGSGNGQFSEPLAATYDSKGNVWVADTGNNRIEEFTEAGAFIRQFGTKGSGNGQLNAPFDVAVDSKGNVWVADYLNNRIEEFTETGGYVRQFSVGTGATGVAIDSKGNIWSTSAKSSGMIEEHTETGGFIRAFGRGGGGPGEIYDQRGIAVDSAGNVWIAEGQNNRMQVFTETGAYLATFGSEGSGPQQMAGTYDVALDPRGNAWVADSFNSRVDKWRIPSPWPPTYSSSFGSEGAGDGQFKHPGDVAVDPKGNLWVVDENNNRVEEFNAGGEYMAKFGSSGTGNGQFSRPTSIALDAKGNIWVTDANNNRVEEFNEKGEYVTKFGFFGTGNGQFSGPEGIAIDAKGNIWVSDTYHGRVQKFNEKGEFIKVVSSYGSGTGQLGEPTGIDIGLNGNVWIADWQNNRLSEFNENGEFLRQVGSSGTGNGQLAHPDAIDADGKGNVWVGDQNNSRIEVFSETGEYITQFGSNGSGAGQFKFSYPIGIATDDRGNTWITDTNNNRVQKWTR
jgi:sugar lactone lactonase YvrE